MIIEARAVSIAVVFLFVTGFLRNVVAGEGDAVIDYNLGLAAKTDGKTKEAYELFKKACLAADGIARACLDWGEMARAGNNDKDIKRALGSAVMLDPENVAARYALALYLIEKQDWTWAIEHLEEALKRAVGKDADLVRYYLGYAQYKNGELAQAAALFEQAGRGLEGEDRQRCYFYKGIVEKQLGEDKRAAESMSEAESDMSNTVGSAASDKLQSWTAFPRVSGFGGQATVSFGYNSHPSTAVLDEMSGVGAEAVLQSIFRADLLLGTSGYSDGFLGGLTLYRDQVWMEFDKKQNSTTEGSFANKMSPMDMNITLFMLQGDYIKRWRAPKMEHEIRMGLGLEFQFLDHLPVEERSDPNDPESSLQIAPSSDSFNLFSWALAGNLWWSFAKTQMSTWSLRLKLELRPNNIDKYLGTTEETVAARGQRSTFRTRLRLHNTSRFAHRTLQLNSMLGGRFDRSYNDARFIKYDRLLGEVSADLKWNTPLPRLSLSLGGKLKYNWYLNSKGNKQNSFRPGYADNPGFTSEQNDAFESDYYDLTRHDFEWELSLEAAVDLWKNAEVALRYVHDSRYSNLDSAPIPMSDPDNDGVYEEVSPVPKFGYNQDQVLLELTQRF